MKLITTPLELMERGLTFIVGLFVPVLEMMYAFAERFPLTFFFMTTALLAWSFGDFFRAICGCSDGKSR